MFQCTKSALDLLLFPTIIH